MVRKLTQLLLIFALTLSASTSSAEILFEGFYRVLQGGIHSGYFVSRHEFDSKKKQFIATSFMKIEGGADFTESIRSVANENFYPVSYAYTAIQQGQTRTVDAKFEKGKINATITANKQTEKVMKEIPKNTILSGFLIYAILRSPQGLKPNIKFDYDAIAEEYGDVKRGTVAVKDFDTYETLKAIRIENTFLDTKSSNLVSEKGEILTTASPTQKIAIELVPQSTLATQGMKVPQGLIKALFGDMPTGLKNVVAQSGVGIKPTATPGKQEGIPGGAGLQLKSGGPAPKAAPDSKASPQQSGDTNKEK